uniref:SJCHGC02606 protein n=1 Tax=Schistosoma japonicum TaxID=6182 RepID=Q5DFA3_SCHJA|nr:SJCHGC02606 protein [Schistosoma japonicum]
MLKNLCKQQIVVSWFAFPSLTLHKINETLKSEITKLNNIIRVVSHEKNLLLDELINNHSTCRNSVKNEPKPFQKSVVCVGNKRSVNFVESCQELKKVKNDPSVIGKSTKFDSFSPPTDTISLIVYFRFPISFKITPQLSGLSYVVLSKSILL